MLAISREVACFALAATMLCASASVAQAETDHAAIARAALTEMIRPGYAAFGEATSALSGKVDTLCKQPSDVALKEARNAFASKFSASARSMRIIASIACSTGLTRKALGSSRCKTHLLTETRPRRCPMSSPRRASHSRACPRSNICSMATAAMRSPRAIRQSTVPSRSRKSRTKPPFAVASPTASPPMWIALPRT